MDTRIQFRVDEEVKNLAQQMAESQGRTISDACRELTEQLAAEQRKLLSHDNWLREQVNQAFAQLDAGKSVFIEHNDAKARMAERKAKISQKVDLYPKSLELHGGGKGTQPHELSRTK